MSDCIGTGCKREGLQQELARLRAERDALRALLEPLVRHCSSEPMTMVPSVHIAAARTELAKEPK